MKAKRLHSRTVEKEQRKLHIPTIDRNVGDPPPFVVVVHGPPQVRWRFLLILFLFSWFLLIGCLFYFVVFQFDVVIVGRKVLAD